MLYLLTYCVEALYLLFCEHLENINMGTEEKFVLVELEFAHFALVFLHSNGNNTN